ncbi:MAG: TadE family type IV pilus minor pilin [Humibacter sp.]
MTAEFAAIVPALLLVLAFCLGAVQVVVQQSRLTDAAADGARSIARGDGVGTADANVSSAVGEASVAVDRGGDYVCVTASQRAAGPAALTGLSVSGKGCALGDAEAGASAEADE